VHETAREFFTWHYPLAKTFALQVLHSLHRLVWVPVMVLQSRSFIIPTQDPWKNAKKGGHLDIRNIQDLSDRRDRGLIPIKLHLQNLGGRLQLCAMSLPTNHIIQTLMNFSFSFPYNQHSFSLNSFTK